MLSEHADQRGVVGERTALEDYRRLDVDTLGKTADRLAGDRVKRRKRQVGGRNALVEQRLDIGLCVHAAAARDLVDGRSPACELLELARFGADPHELCHLVDKCTGTACARAVHAHVGNLDVSLIVGAEEDHLGVLAAQLDGAARLRIEPADRERVGDHLLNVRGAQRGRDIARARAGHRNAQRLMGKALGELAEHGAHARCLTRPVAAISPPRLGHILVHRVNFGRRRPYVQSY